MTERGERFTREDSDRTFKERFEMKIIRRKEREGRENRLTNTLKKD